MTGGSYLKKVAIVGAGGNVGSKVLKHLLDINRDIQVTVITRPDSKSTFPTSPQITVKKGSYEDASFLDDTFQGHDLALFALSVSASNEESRLIDAAAKAGVKWLIPNQYAGDMLNPVHRNGSPWYQPKIDALKQVEELAKTHHGLKWIGVATNFWTEMNVNSAALGVDVKNHTATFWDDAGPFNSTSIDQVGLGIAKLLSLPTKSDTNPRASLQHYANNFVYLSSFVLTQQKVFESVKRVTGTSDADWEIVHSSSEAELQKHGGSQGMYSIIVNYIRKDRGGDYEPKAKEDREALGLKEENLDEVVKKALAIGST